MEFAIYMLLGAAAGVMAGLFGVGGGMIIVPVLVFSFNAQGFAPEVLTHLAVGTSLATIVVTSINSTREHNRRGAVQWNLVRWLTPGILMGAALGGVTAAMINGPILQKIIGVFAICIALQLALNLNPKAAGTLPKRPELIAVGSIIGWASAIFGVGGGSLTVPFLVWRSIAMQKAVATSAACGFPIALAGTLVFIATGWHEETLPKWSIGFIYLPAVLGITMTSVFFARIGARLAHRLSPLLLKRLFALLLTVVGISFLLN